MSVMIVIEAMLEEKQMALEVVDSPQVRFAQDAERRRIARDLHDGVVQSLAALVADLEHFRTRRLPTGGETNQEIAKKMELWEELARDSLLSMRETLSDLRDHTEYDYGIESAVRTLLEELHVRGYRVVLECENWPDRLPHDYALNLYSIIREAITNICKHARASKISVFMFNHEGDLHVSIVDNGVGMTIPAELSSKGGYHQGLIGLHERAAMLEGVCSIESKLGKGTRVDVAVPQPEN